MFASKRRRRERLRNEPFPNDWDATLKQNVPYYKCLPPEDQRELRGHIQVLIAEKNWEGCGGLTLTDEIKVTIAGQAAVLLLHRDTDYFPDLISILVYPDAFVVPHVGEDDENLPEVPPDVRYGESWDWGTVVLSWSHALHGTRNPTDGQNLILHEFAHQLDHEDGVTDGAPLLDDRSARIEWSRVLGGQYEQLVRDLQQRTGTLIDSYGATSPAEFFAVITECFFELPSDMLRHHPDLYGVLKHFYCQDPAALLRPTP